MKKTQIFRLVLSALFLALGFVLPFLTGQIPQVGSMLLPMHLPALVCGFVCGWPWGLAVGFVMPIARSFLFGMPPLVPTAYGALIGAMLAGRVAWGLASWAIYALLTPNSFALATFWTGGFVNAWPGMVLQVVLVPLVVLSLERARLIPLKEN